MNKVILIGRLCADVEARHTNSGKTVSTYRLAVDRQFKTEGQPEADFLTCVAFGNNGDFAAKYLHKGMKIAVEGRIQTRTYEDKDGKKVYVTEIVVGRHEFCERKESGGYAAPGHNAPAANEPTNYAAVTDDDSELPF